MTNDTNNATREEGELSDAELNGVAGGAGISGEVKKAASAFASSAGIGSSAAQAQEAFAPDAHKAGKSAENAVPDTMKSSQNKASGADQDTMSSKVAEAMKNVAAVSGKLGSQPVEVRLEELKKKAAEQEAVVSKITDVVIKGGAASGKPDDHPADTKMEEAKKKAGAIQAIDAKSDDLGKSPSKPSVGLAAADEQRAKAKLAEADAQKIASTKQENAKTQVQDQMGDMVKSVVEKIKEMKDAQADAMKSLTRS